MKKYKIAAMIIVLIYFFQTFFTSLGGIGADSLSYFGIAADLPKPETNLFPMGYPILVRLVYNVLHDYFWASKILNLLFTVIILLFSYYKNFYFRETVLLFMGKTFFTVFIGAASETLFLFLMYFLFFLFHQLLSKKDNLYSYAVAISLCLIGLFITRYSGIYIYVSVVVFCGVMFFKIRDRIYFKPLILMVFLSGIGIGSYLLFNVMHFGDYTGERLRGKPSSMDVIYIVRDVFGVMNSIDPYIGIKPASNSLASLLFQFLVFVIDVFIFFFFLKYFKKGKESSLYYFHILLWVMAGVSGISVLVSGWFQQIEEMGVRLMAASNFCLFFSFLILYFQNQLSDKWIWRVSCFFLIFLICYSLKDPGNYLENKKQIEPQMAKFKNKKYLYNNEKNKITVTTYYFPVIDKKFDYKHTNSQKGSLKEGVAGTVNPKIKWLMNDTVRDKTKVLYTSQLRFK